MDEKHLYLAVGYVDLNSVKSGLVETPEQWEWPGSSAHILGEDEQMVSAAPKLQGVGTWSTYLSGRTGVSDEELLQLLEKTGRSLRSETIIDLMEKHSNRQLRPLKPGSKTRL